MNTTDYMLYRGKCKEMAEAAIQTDPTLKLVRGWYLCPIWGKQGHFWAVKPDGTIVDPTVKQFPTAGVGAEYIPYDGCDNCEFCGKRVAEKDAHIAHGHFYCSYECYGHDVGF